MVTVLKGNLARKDEEKAEVLNAFSASVFNSQTGHPQGSQAPVLGDGVTVQNEVPVVEEVAVTDLLLHLDVHKSMGPDGST